MTHHLVIFFSFVKHTIAPYYNVVNVATLCQVVYCGALHRTLRGHRARIIKHIYNKARYKVLFIWLNALRPPNQSLL